MSSESSSRSNVLIFLSPLILIVVALFQIGLVLSIEISPWKGGGFGMFSTSDTPGNRSLDIFLVTDNSERLINLPDTDSFNRLYIKTKTIPSKRNLNRILYKVSNKNWYCTKIISKLDFIGNRCLVQKDAEEIILSSDEENLLERFTPQSIRVELRKSQYDGPKSKFNRTVIKTKTVSLK